MGLLNKLKNVLFEEEIIEVPVEEPVKKVKEEKTYTEKKRNVYEEEHLDDSPIISDRDLFKAEKTFDFPVFDDEEFEDMKDNQVSNYYEEEPKSMSINLFDYEKPKIKKEKYPSKTPEIKGRAYDTKKKDFGSKKFQPSPVISPVYGVLDKNYKKEDIIVKQEEKKQIDVDDVRKKAFGTLEDDIEKNLMEPARQKVTSKRKEEMQEEKTIDELLEETTFDTIDIPEFNEEELRAEDRMDNTQDLDLEVLDKPEEKTEQEKIEDNDTLENDLFELIDSMYENREEE